MPVRARSGWTVTEGEIKVTKRSVDALIANFFDLDQAVEDGLRRLAEVYAEKIQTQTEMTAPFGKEFDPPWHPGYMRSHVHKRFSPSGLAFEVGWDEADTEAIGENFYFKFQELTGWTDDKGVYHPPRPSLQPAYEFWRPEYQAAVARMVAGETRKRSAR
jgi:hypothetical protein